MSPGRKRLYVDVSVVEAPSRKNRASPVYEAANCKVLKEE